MDIDRDEKKTRTSFEAYAVTLLRVAEIATHHRVWNRVYILRVRSEIGYEKSYILVWNRVRVFRTGPHTHLKTQPSGVIFPWRTGSLGHPVSWNHSSFYCLDSKDLVMGKDRHSIELCRKHCQSFNCEISDVNNSLIADCALLNLCAGAWRSAAACK